MSYFNYIPAFDFILLNLCYESHNVMCHAIQAYSHVQKLKPYTYYIPEIVFLLY